MARVTPRIAEALVDSTHDGLFAVDEAGTVLAWTWGAQNLYGFTPEEVVGRSMIDLLVPPAGQDEARAALHECRNTGSAVLDCLRCTSGGGEVQVQSILRWVATSGEETGFAAVSDNDVTEARRLEAELSQQVWSLTGVQEFLKSVLDASTDYSIIALDLHQRVLAWNAGARYDFGYIFEVVKDRPLAGLVAGPAPEDHQEFEGAFETCLAEERAEAELTLSRQDRRTFPARVTITLRKDAFGAPAGFVLIAKDIAEERRAEAERRVALERLLEIRRLGEMDKIKTAILNTTSHELATPLTPIRLHLHLLRSAAPDQVAAPLRKSIETLDRNFSRLHQVVQGMVDVVQMQTGPRLEVLQLDLARLATDLASSNQAVAQAAGVSLAVDAPVAVPVAADPQRLRQLGQNLLANALRFTPASGSVLVTVQAVGDRAVLRVKDTGPGLSEAQIARLFQPFSQVHDTTQETKGGIGVGLYMCRAIAEAHGGRVRCESAGPGQGSTFVAELPLAGPSAGAAAPG